VAVPQTLWSYLIVTSYIRWRCRGALHARVSYRDRHFCGLVHASRIAGSRYHLCIVHYSPPGDLPRRPYPTYVPPAHSAAPLPRMPRWRPIFAHLTTLYRYLQNHPTCQYDQ